VSDYSGQTVHIAVPRILPTWNELLSGKYMNPHAYRRLRDGWQSDMYHLIGHRDRAWLEAMAALKKKMRVEVHSERRRRVDPDNLSVKVLLDALKRNKFIHDDGEKYCEHVVTQSKGPTIETRITISEAK